MKKKDKILYFIIPIIINLISFTSFNLIFSLNNLKNLLILEIATHIIIALYLFSINIKNNKMSKLKLFIIFSVSFITDFIVMFLFAFKAHYSINFVKILSITIMLLEDYIIKKIFIKNKYDIKKEINNNFNSYLFLSIYVVFSLIVFVKLCLNSNTTNYVENRSSYRFKFPTINEILNVTFQDNFENAVIDQMPKNDLLKKVYNKISINALFSALEFMDIDKLNKYVMINNGMNLYKNYLIYGIQSEEDFKINAQDDIEKINNIHDYVNANMYLYFVETDTNNKFDIDYNYDIINYLNTELKLSRDNIGIYEINKFSDYKDNFYKTDHHWNHKGSYKGYIEISKMMDFDDIYLNDKEICFEKFKYRGSKAITLGGSGLLYDKVCIYDFEFPEFDIVADNTSIEEYGSNINEISKGNDISYGSVYGGDYAEIVFTNKEVKNNKKLLIYSNSYSNAINKLLASNYETTYVIDGRHYKEYDMISYINNNDIDDVLIIANSMLFWDNVDW